MSVSPKRKISKQRRNKRAANWKLEQPTLTSCPHCHEPKLGHKMCKHCGYYNGRIIKAPKAEKAE